VEVECVDLSPAAISTPLGSFFFSEVPRPETPLAIWEQNHQRAARPQLFYLDEGVRQRVERNWHAARLLDGQCVHEMRDAADGSFGMLWVGDGGIDTLEELWADSCA
jgi:hypothetical protein